MKRWLKRTLFGVFGASILVGGLTGCGHGAQRGWGGAMSEADATQMRERMIDRASDRLKLDAAQRQKLVVLAEKLREQRRALVGSGTDPRAEVESLVAGPTFDREHARSFIESKTAALNAKSPEVIAAAGDFFDSLKPEQQQQVREFMARRRGWHRRG